MSQSSFVGWIKAAAKKAMPIFAAVVKVSAVVAPGVEVGLVASGHADIASTLNKIENVAVGVETVSENAGGLEGSQKLAMAVPAVDALIKNSGFLGNRAIADVSKWDAAVAAFTSAAVDLSNATMAVEDKSASGTGQTAGK